jgi:type III restriction enzyme
LAIDRSNPERNFEKFLAENDSKIDWWWKNGVNKKDYFGLKYEYPKNVINTFYPDYLIKFTNGKLGIFEIKDSNDREGATSTKMKAEALQLYITNQNNKDLVGGILIERKDGWKINDKDVYNWNDTLNNNWSDWIEFSFL